MAEKTPTRRAPRRAAEQTRRAQSERTQLHLLQTATWLFSERGFHGTGIRDIADAAGVAVSAMYYYARSKDEVLDAVMQRGLERLDGASSEALEGVSGASERLATLISVHVALHARNPRTTSVIDQELNALPAPVRKRTLAQRDVYEARWEAVLRAGVDGGEFVERGRVGRLALLQMCTGVAHWYRPRGEMRVVELCDRFADMGLALMGARRGGEAVEVAALDLAPRERLLPLVEIPTEPRRKPSGA
ncbi:TetR/AcrR family transcriptional regulator [Conexibacter woesei]|uniref:Transcriptional regulator, TetR family n=1 Tax=Conexibacter woesei (strain DSM 14684 / CCUG 47730 / CIP 108061 / JCM 11494 / NBRC 100937 / ID131577) TaxID=469383 RepID=D3F5J1_CONWI|nr:TetR/AcrR family transcriptional regulator [Conexibacter woesei]ADB50658.1 transcriptional regulator, TetR family [Conexibacter woesei DSM 14684]